MKLTVNRRERIIEEEVALALRFLRFQQQIDELEDIIATKITKRKFKQIIREETQKALNERTNKPARPASTKLARMLVQLDDKPTQRVIKAADNLFVKSGRELQDAIRKRTGELDSTAHFGGTYDGGKEEYTYKDKNGKIHTITPDRLHLYIGKKLGELRGDIMRKLGAILHGRKRYQPEMTSAKKKSCRTGFSWDASNQKCIPWAEVDW